MVHSLTEIRAQMPGTTVVKKPNQGNIPFLLRRAGIKRRGLFCLSAFCIQAEVPWRLSDGNPAGASKKVQNIKEDNIPIK